MITNTTTTTYNWADLPVEILEMIGNRLENRVDVYRFRAICKSWRSVVPLSQHTSTPLSPPLHLPLPCTSTALLFPFVVARLEDETRTNFCLVKLTQSSSGKIKLSNPLSTCSRPRPHKRERSNITTSKASVNVMSLRVVEVCKGYYFKCDRKSRDGELIKKVVLFGDCGGVLVIYGIGKLGYLGFEDENWTVLGTDGVKYEDVSLYKGQFYVVDNVGTVYWVDAKSMTLVQFSPPLFGFGQAKNLVVSDGDLFVVDSYFDEGMERGVQRQVFNFERVDIRVYRLDEEWGTWVNVKSLGDRVFVLGKEVCFSVSTKDFPGCVRNCVYFMDSKLEDRHVGTEFRRFFGRVLDFDDRGRMKTVDCFPFHRKLFSVPMNFPYTPGSPPFLGDIETLE